MQIQRLEISGLRNIVSALVFPGQQGNLLYGRNGAGKTSLLEAIYLLGNGKSFRGGHIQSLINDSAVGLKVSSKVAGLDQNISDFQLTRKGGEKRVLVNRTVVPNRSSLARQFPIMFFGHETVSAQIATPEARRVFFDWLLFHVEPSFLSVYSNYMGLLKQLKAGLRANIKDGGLWNIYVGDAGEQLHGLRVLVYEELKVIFKEELNKFPELPKVDLVYRCGWSNGQTLAELLQSRHLDHVRLGYCTVGPHRADLQIRNERGEVRGWASRGQLKAYYGIYFLAVLRYFLQNSRYHPLVLIDDLWAEMDTNVAGQFLKSIMACECQFFLTSITAREELVSQYDLTSFHVEHGLVRS